MHPMFLVALALTLHPHRPRAGVEETTWPRVGIDESSDRPGGGSGDADRGRLFFSDPRLSAGGKVACATCHNPRHAYGPGAAVVGLDGRPLARKPPSLFNVGHQRSLFWDGRAATLEAQVRGPLTNPAEMGAQSVPEVLERLRPHYGRLTAEDLAGDLAAFERTLASPPTRFDQYLAGGDTLSAAEARGWQLFRTRALCYECHTTKSPFTDGGFHATGWGDGTDRGRAGVTGKAADLGAFKTPQLRGVRHAGPWMHDGRAASLEDVVDFYDRGRGPELHPLHLSDRDRRDLVAFLKSL